MGTLEPQFQIPDFLEEYNSRAGSAATGFDLELQGWIWSSWGEDGVQAIVFLNVFIFT